MKKVLNLVAVLALIFCVMIACATAAEASTKVYFPGSSVASVTLPNNWSLYSSTSTTKTYRWLTSTDMVSFSSTSVSTYMNGTTLASVLSRTGYSSIKYGTINGYPAAYGYKYSSGKYYFMYTFYYNYRVYQMLAGDGYYSNYDYYTKIANTFTTSGYTPQPSPSPYNVTITKAAQVGKSGVKLYFTPVSGVKYAVYRSTNPYSGFIWTGNLANATGTDTVYVATAGMTYYYKLRPYVESNGVRTYGNYSNTVSVSFLTAPTITGVSNYATNAAKVTYTRVDGSSGHALYQKKQGVGELEWKQTVTGTTAYAYNLDAGSTVWFQVRGIIDQPDGTRGVGMASPAKSVIIPGKPTGVNGTWTRTGTYATASMSWKRVYNITGYEVYSSSSANGTYSLVGRTTATSMKIYNLRRGTTTYFKVRCYVVLSDGTKAYGSFSDVVYASVY